MTDKKEDYVKSCQTIESHDDINLYLTFLALMILFLEWRLCYFHKLFPEMALILLFKVSCWRLKRKQKKRKPSKKFLPNLVKSSSLYFILS